MAKINKYPIKSFAPVVCEVCGCEYEFEVGDTLKRIFRLSKDSDKPFDYEEDEFILKCPICCTGNRIKKKALL